MNKQRRKSLQEIVNQLNDLKVDLVFLVDEEDCYVENIPENLQGSERAERAEEALSCLNDAFDNLDECICNIESAIEC